MTTKIQWCDKTWNPITGCTKISEGCENCYAEKMAKRLQGRFGYPSDDPFRPGTFHDDKLIQPVHWKKPRRIFVCSMSDIFHEDVTEEQINKVTSIMVHPMSGASHHTYIILTKRPDRIPKTSYERISDWKNVWFGITAENQKRYEERWKVLRKIYPVIRFISVEPMLEPIQLNLEINPDWVICGPETGQNPRYFNKEWARNLRDQCKESGIPFFYKQHDRSDCLEDLRIKEFPK